jgi:aspartate aminotransferase
MPRSGIREIMDLAWATPDVIHLEVGEPNFPTPQHVIEAADRAARAGYTKYTPNAGLPQLREALVDKLRARNRIDARPGQMIVTHGAVEALYTSLLALVGPGDEILLPDPGWPNYRMMTTLTRTEARYYPLTPAGRYLPQIDDLERLIGSRTRVLLLNSPSNPLGAIIPEARMRELLAFAAEHDLWVVSDECYDEIVFDSSFVSAAALAEEERVVSVFSFSKTYAMTGWRVGCRAGAAGPGADQAAGADHLLRQHARSDGGAGRRHRAAGPRPRDDGAVQGPTRPGARRARPDRPAGVQALRGLLPVGRCQRLQVLERGVRHHPDP